MTEYLSSRISLLVRLINSLKTVIFYNFKGFSKNTCKEILNNDTIIKMNEIEMQINTENFIVDTVKYMIHNCDTNMITISNDIKKDLEIYFTKVEETPITYINQSDTSHVSLRFIFSELGRIKDLNSWPSNMRIGKNYLQKE